MDVKSDEKSLSVGDELQLIALLRPLLSALATLIEELRNQNSLQADLVTRLLEQNAQLMQTMYEQEPHDPDMPGMQFDLEGKPIIS